MDETLCRSNLSGVITTDDGAEIHFDSMGFFLRPHLDREPDRWRTSAAVHFTSSDPRYAWLDGALAYWEGDFDLSAGRHVYRVNGPAS